MLQIKVPLSNIELWDDNKQRFIKLEDKTLDLEHSLLSISKWESKWHIPYMREVEKTREQQIDYIKCMTLNEDVDPDVYQFLTEENIHEINRYITDKRTATWFSDSSDKKGTDRETTSELVYYQMTAFNIPFECEKWHINRLLTLIKVCSIESQPKQKMSQKELVSQRAALNAARRKKYNTRG